MSAKLCRRGFLSSATAFAAYGCVSGGKRTDYAEYSVPILGDVHFDETEWGLYHVGWKGRNASDERCRAREFRRNAEMWRARLPSLIAAAAACSRPEDTFLLQLGDLVQGDCGDASAQIRMFRDAIAACRKGFGSLPFLTVCGNHDIRNGGREPYDRFFPPFLSRELGERVDSTTFHFMRGRDVWLFADFTKPDAERIFSALKATEGSRYTFVVSHGPVTPADNWGFYWFLFGKKKDTEIRRRLRKELMRRKAIVLCGHTHYMELTEWNTRDGVLTQFSANSVWNDPALCTPVLRTDDPKSWGRLYVESHASDAPEEHDGQFSDRTRAESLALMREYADGLVRYEKYSAAGHYRLGVSDAGVYMDFYGGDSRTPGRRFRLR